MSPPTEAAVGLGRRAVLLDKDGTLVENVPYNVDPGLLRLTPGAAEGVRRLAQAGYRLIVVSNQSGVARGLFPESALAAVERRLGELLAAAGARLDGFYYCPHHPAGRVASLARACECRKPRPGLLRRAAREHGLELTRCWLIGDILDDVQAGRAAGCRTVLLDNGHETEWLLSRERLPDHQVADLDQAARLILALDGVSAEREPAGALGGRRWG